MLVACAECGQWISDRAAFCTHCGHRIAGAETAPAEAAAPEVAPPPVPAPVEPPADHRPLSDASVLIGVGGLLLLIVVAIAFYLMLAPARSDEAAAEDSNALEAPLHTRFRVTAAANVRREPHSRGALVAQARPGGWVTGDFVTSANQRWLRLKDGEFGGNYIWDGNLEGVADAASGAPATFGPPPPPPAPAGPSPQWLIGTWRAADGRSTCNTPALVFGRDLRVRWYRDTGEWEFDRNRVAIVWTGGPTFNTMNPYPEYYPIERIDDNRLGIRTDDGFTRVYERCR